MLLILYWILSFIGPFLVAYENNYYVDILSADN